MRRNDVFLQIFLFVATGYDVLRMADGVCHTGGGVAVGSLFLFLILFSTRTKFPVFQTIQTDFQRSADLDSCLFRLERDISHSAAFRTNSEAGITELLTRIGLKIIFGKKYSAS